MVIQFGGKMTELRGVGAIPSRCRAMFASDCERIGIAHVLIVNLLGIRDEIARWDGRRTSKRVNGKFEAGPKN